MTPTISGGLRECSNSRLADPLHHLQVVDPVKTIAATKAEAARQEKDAPNHAPRQRRRAAC